MPAPGLPMLPVSISGRWTARLCRAEPVVDALAHVDGGRLDGGEVNSELLDERAGAPLISEAVWRS